MSFDPVAIRKEFEFLSDNPHFQERPASIKEFLGPEYLNIEGKIRPGLMVALEDIFGGEPNPHRIGKFERAMITGGIGIGKTTFASVALPYMAHWVLCLKDPQSYFGLLPGSRIAFMQMSTSEKQALEVVFGDIFARIKHAKWFVENYPHDDKFTKMIRFPKDIWILPGDSSETTFEGYNILGGILDEMDSHKTTETKGDYADLGFDTIHSRIASRYIDEDAGGHKGLLICIGQMKKGNGFAARKYAEMMEDDKAYVVRMTIWESLGWHRFMKNGERDSFFYDVKRKQIIPRGVAALVTNSDLIEVPTAYRKDFENNPEKALKDLAGIPPATNDPFISLVHKIELCRDKWNERYPGVGSPADENPTRPKLAEWFMAPDKRRRAVHLDIATSGNGDALGLCMGHVEDIVEVEDEKMPYIVIDLLLRIKAMPGTEIMLSDVRRLLYDLKAERGYRIIDVTMDGFQSTDTMQQLRKKKFRADYLSVDRSTLPYEDLREAIYDERLEFPTYMTYKNKGDLKQVEIVLQELMQLTHDGKKVDHPPQGSKDVADALAGVVSTLMGDRAYRKGVTSLHGSTSAEEYERESQAMPAGGPNGMVLPIPGRDGIGLKAPMPPSFGGMSGLSIPRHLQPKR